jgi:hypothetical protein
MIRIRILAISVFSAILSAASLVCAQNAEPRESAVALRQPPAIQELELRPQALLAEPQLAVYPLLSPSIAAPDLSRYREFQLGMSLLAVEKLTSMDPSEATTTFERPALIQKLDWQILPSLDSSVPADPVEEVTFSFYNGDLFRMVVTYDEDRTEGLTEADLVKAVSAAYGTSTRPARKTVLASPFSSSGEGEEVLARWQDSQCSISLFRSSSYGTGYGILLFSKRLDALARTAALEAARLEEQAAPQREAERQKKELDDNRTQQQQRKLTNKAAFRL